LDDPSPIVAEGAIKKGSHVEEEGTSKWLEMNSKIFFGAFSEFRKIKSEEAAAGVGLGRSQPNMLGLALDDPSPTSSQTGNLGSLSFSLSPGWSNPLQKQK
jgi:hypothetical protein